MRKSIGLMVLPLAFAACTSTTQGDRGVVSFTPEDCGMTFCSLAQELAVGSSTDVSLSGKADLATLSLTTDNANVAMVFPLPGFAWQVVGTGYGATKLVVLRGNSVVDKTTIRVAYADRYTLKVNSGPAFMEADSYPGDEVWSFSAGRAMSFQIRPLDDFGDELMGRVNLSVAIDAPLYDALAPSADLNSGELELFGMAPGYYGLSATAPDGATFDLTLIAR